MQPGPRDLSSSAAGVLSPDCVGEGPESTLSARPEIIESTFDRVKYGLTTQLGYYML